MYTAVVEYGKPGEPGALKSYLNRALFPALVQTLRPGGLLLYKTFNTNMLRTRPGFNPDYLLDPGELARLLSALAPLQTNDHADNLDPYSWWVGGRV